MIDYKEVLKKRGLTDKEISTAMESNYYVKIKGLDEGVEVPRNNASELVYYFRKPLDKILEELAGDAIKSGNQYDFYGHWLYETSDKIWNEKRDNYRTFLQEANKYVEKNGIFSE